jgi:rhodanese-related sulfurtransferase
MSDKSQKETYRLFDCRFPFEFDAGSLKEARSMYDPELLKEYFFNQKKRSSSRNYIFFCEFSSQRAPRM